MDRIYINRIPGGGRIHIEIDENEVADLLDDLRPLDGDAFASTHRLVALLEDAHDDLGRTRNGDN